MLIRYTGKLLKVAGKFASSIACCCGGGDTGNKWYCLTSSDGSYRCAQDYDISQDQVLSEHGSESECNQQCGQGSVWCYFDDDIGYFCTDYWDGDGALSGPYPDTITCNAACQQMWFCVDKGSGGGETQYECVLQDPYEDYLSGPYGSKNACEYRCGDSFYCVYKYINTDEYEYECVQSNEGEPDNVVSGPYQSATTCEEYCKACEEVELPDQKDCPDCVDAACEYMTDGGLDGGEWGTCCAGLIETWRYCDGEWELIMPCHPEGEKTAGTPACEVYPEKLDFPDDPAEGQIYSVECDRVLGFDPADYPDCVSCNYTCVEDSGTFDCIMDSSGMHRTLQQCLASCPEKWSCISTDECVQRVDGKYETESECVEAAPVDCAATGACCFPDGDIAAHCHDDAPLNQEGPCLNAGGTFYVNESCAEACPQPDPYGCCCYLDSEGNWQTEQLRKSDCDLKPQSSHSPDTDCDDVECPPPTPTELGCCYNDIGDGTLKSEGRTTKADCQAAQDEVDPAIECTWIADTEETKDQPCPDQPVYPPVPGICLYRDDGLGSCWGYDFETYEYGSFDTEAEAQSWIDQGNCPGNPLPDAPSCASCSCEAAILSDMWTVIQTCIRFEEEVDEFGNQTGSYICSKTIYLSSCTEDQCDAQGETNPLADIEWRNDKPANKCKVVASEDDCTESTGVFCPEVTECPDDLTAGCPDPNRSISFAPPP